MTATATLVGNTTRPPELKYTAAGQGVASFAVAVNRRWKDRNGDWQEQVSFFDVSCWGDLAENVTSTVEKGCRVTVTGRLEQQRWETGDGETRSKIVVVADDVAVSLRWATADVHRTERRQPGEPAASSSRYDEEPF